jgi:hypothetical protein
MSDWPHIALFLCFSRPLPLYGRTDRHMCNWILFILDLHWPVVHFNIRCSFFIVASFYTFPVSSSSWFYPCIHVIYFNADHQTHKKRKELQICNLPTWKWRHRSLSDKSSWRIINRLPSAPISSAIKPMFMLMKYDYLLNYIFLYGPLNMFFYLNSQHSVPSCLCVNFCPCYSCRSLL